MWEADLIVVRILVECVRDVVLHVVPLEGLLLLRGQGQERAVLLVRVARQGGIDALSREEVVDHLVVGLPFGNVRVGHVGDLPVVVEAEVVAEGLLSPSANVVAQCRRSGILAADKDKSHGSPRNREIALQGTAKRVCCTGGLWANPGTRFRAVAVGGVCTSSVGGHYERRRCILFRNSHVGNLCYT